MAERRAAYGLIVSCKSEVRPSVQLTYDQAGQDYGLRFLWLLVVMAGIFLVSQDMVGRLAAVTGAGHARPIYERPGSRWGAFALSDC